jgi:hypothetical protein
MPLATIDRKPRAAARPAATSDIFPSRTMIVPESITVPLPTTIRALTIATSCAFVGFVLSKPIAVPTDSPTASRDKSALTSQISPVCRFPNSPAQSGQRQV